MTIEITDNRQQWLISMGEDLAKAMREEKAAEEAYSKARKRRLQIEDGIVRIGGYILDARKESGK